MVLENQMESFINIHVYSFKKYESIRPKLVSYTFTTSTHLIILEIHINSKAIAFILYLRHYSLDILNWILNKVTSKPRYM